MNEATKTPAVERSRLAALARQAGSLLVLERAAQASPIAEVTRVLQALGDGEKGEDGALEKYGALFRALMHVSPSPTGDPLTRGIIHCLVAEESALSRWVEEQSQTEPRARLAPALPQSLVDAVAHDLRVLQALARIGPELPALVAHSQDLPSPLPWLHDTLTPLRPAEAKRPMDSTLDRLATRFVQAKDWGALASELVAHYASHGSGPLAQFRAFRWMGPADGLTPVPVPDAVRPEDLIGYAAERALLRQNTEHFLAGYPANNVLLYGDRGTGKSSSVKALLNEQDTNAGVDWDQLRLIEVPKARLADFPAIVSLIRAKPQRFILFVDDLSFEEGETQYKDMKAMLEGGLEARPANVVVYATSNRRHLIRELFSDRTSNASEDVHARDTVQEKLSFADRFGLTITFPTPDQQAYLHIVEGLARQRGLMVETATLRARAIEWAAWHNGRSGRTAKQFVDHLAAEIGIGSTP